MQEDEAQNYRFLQELLEAKKELDAIEDNPSLAKSMTIDELLQSLTDAND